MSSGMDVQMDHDSLTYALAQFPMVVFKPVPWIDLPVCQGCVNPCGLADGCDSTAVLVSRRYLGETVEGQPVYSHTNRMPVAECCLAWELRQLIKHGVDVTVEVLREVA